MFIYIYIYIYIYTCIKDCWKIDEHLQMILGKF